MYGYVYITTNLINGKRYIGQHHCDHFDENYKGSGKILLRSIKKYGWDNFKTEIIEECDSFELLNERENYWIEYYNAVNSREFYNILSGTFQFSTEDLLNSRRNKYNGDASPWFHTKSANERRLKSVQDKYGRSIAIDNTDPEMIDKQISSRRNKYGDPAFNLRTSESVSKSVESRRSIYGSCTVFMNTPQAQENKRRTQSYIFELDGKQFIGIGELSEYLRSTYFPTISNSSVKRIAIRGFVSKKYKSICNGKIKIIKEPNIDPRTLSTNTNTNN